MWLFEKIFWFKARLKHSNAVPKNPKVYLGYPAPGKGFQAPVVKVPISVLDRLANNWCHFLDRLHIVWNVASGVHLE